MDQVTKTNKQLLDMKGTITSPDGLRIDVRFDLIEMEDLVDGRPASRYSYGVLRYVEPLEPAIKPRLLSAACLTLTGGGIHASLCLYKINTFTLTDTIPEFLPSISIAPVARLAAA
jgi:hypothetical protein